MRGMASAFDFKLLLSMLCIMGTILAAACKYGLSADGAPSGSLPGIGG